MRDKIRLLLLISVLVSSSRVCGQSSPNTSDFTKIIEVLPPSPNAASLGKYGGIDAGLSSGTPNINIPLYDYSSINIKMPLSISYSGSGVKIDEIASRVGINWNLNAGGVITRTVFGSADETAQRVSPANYTTVSRDWVNCVDALSSGNTTGGSDGQPDLFNFNVGGYSGRFILDSSLNALLLSYSALKIENSFDSTGAWNFKLTTTDGVQYFFGGVGATEVTNKQSVGNGCGKGYPNFTPTAWYLNKIIHPNHDTLTLTYSSVGMHYKTGISETMYSPVLGVLGFLDPSYGCACAQVTAPTLNNTVCTGWLQTNGALLQEINSTGGAKIKFYYISRTDYDDKLLTRIEVYQPGQSTVFKKFGFSYDQVKATSLSNSYSGSDTSLKYRPFLTSVSECSSDSSLLKTYRFYYNDNSSLPPRFSYAQDHYGYFNGKSNSTLIPKPFWPTWQVNLPSATANRDVDSSYSSKGMLSKVVYPTGGNDSLIYESNKVYKQVAVMPPQTIIDAYATNPDLPGGGTTVYSDTAVISFDQEVHFSGGCSYAIPTSGDPIHDKAIINIIDLSNQSNLISLTKTPGQTFDVIVLLTAGHSYKIKSSAYGQDVSGGGTLYYRAGNVTYPYMNVNTGGVRIAKVISSDNITSVKNVKRYFYNKLSSIDTSSAVEIYVPSYTKTLKVYSVCANGNTSNCTGIGEGGVADCGVSEFDFYSTYSNTVNNIYAFSGLPVSYAYVTESFGDNFENGGIEHGFTVYPDVLANVLNGEAMIGAPLTSFNYKNAREIFQHVFKKNGANYISVKKVFTNFKEDSRIDQEVKAYLVNKKYSVSCQYTPPEEKEMNAYDLSSFTYYRKWFYQDSIRIWTYDIAGQNYAEQLDITEYANQNHALPTKKTTYASDGSANKATTYYPQDLSLSGTEETARQVMVNKHIYDPVLQQEILNGSDTLYKTKASYYIFPDSVVAAQSHWVKTTTNPLEKRVEYYKYNRYGKILEQGKTSDQKIAYLWDYNSQYPIAEVNNADSAGIAYTSFEADSKGGWTYSGSVSTDSSAPTGIKCYNTTGGNLTRTSLTNTTYIVSYWGKSGSVNVNGNGPTQTGRSFGNWTYYEHEVTTTSITVSGSKYIDELRLYPKGAFMSTATYKPLVGITSQCDANNRISYYEYDGLGRLLIVRDQDNKLLKKICYNYAGQPENCINITFGNAVKSGNFTRNNCSCGYTGGTVTYTVAANTYFSSISQADADQQAQNDVNANGQTYANTNGSCTAITFYARIELANIYNDVDITTADVYIRFYSDASCTIPISACGLNVNYKKVRTLCSGGSPITTNYTANNCTGTQVLLGNYTISQDDGIHCYNYTFSTTAGTGYTPK